MTEPTATRPGTGLGKRLLGTRTTRSAVDRLRSSLVRSRIRSPMNALLAMGRFIVSARGSPASQGDLGVRSGACLRTGL
jgi:hypothetical protein